MHWIDWSILIAVAVGITLVAVSTRKYTKSVADFLSANRCAGKYLLGVADGIAGLGAITIIASFEAHYKAGFSAIWWGSIILPVTVIVAMTGWVQYRFRETRALTMAQFFEIRYSRRFRIFSGVVGFLSGILNFGIFPAVGGRFFQHYADLPSHFVSIAGLQVDLVYALIMIILLVISVAFTFMGGQIAVIVTDFIQGSFCNIVFVGIAAYLLFVYFDWSQIMTAVSSAPEKASLINPANTSKTDNFASTFYFILAFKMVYGFMAWQGNQGYFSAARTPHDARMGKILGSFRTIIQTIPIVLLAIGAYTVLHHPEFQGVADAVHAKLAVVGNEKIQSQLTVSVCAAHILPVGLMGLFAAVMFAAFISTHDTYLHSWGSIFIQDIYLPVKQIVSKDNKPISAKRHITLLRMAIIGVSIFIFIFSLLFNQKQDIFMFFSLTGSLFVGWAGAVIIGGLYWKHGNVFGAWAASISGVFLAATTWIIINYWSWFYTTFGTTIPTCVLPEGFDPAGSAPPYNAMIMSFFLMMGVISIYVIVSLIFCRGRAFNMDKMLHRGKYTIDGDHIERQKKQPGILGYIGITKEFSFGDIVAFLCGYGYVFILSLIFIAGTVYMLKFDIQDSAWASFWWIYAIVMLVFSAAITVWLTIGGCLDLRKLFATLKEAKRDTNDDGEIHTEDECDGERE